MSSLSPAAARQRFWQSAGNVLTRLRGRHGWTHRELAERAGLDPEGLVALATHDPTRNIGPLDGLADELRPTTDQKKALAYAYAYDRDVVVEAIRRSDAFNAAYTVVEDSEDLDPGERERVLDLLRVEGKSAAREAERLRAAVCGGPA